FLKGKWTLVLEVLDETSVNSVSVKKGNSNLTDGTDFFKKDVSYTSPDKKGYQVYIPISNEESKVEYTVTALDSEHTASQSFSFNIDEIAPTLDSVTGNGTLFESADFTSIENNNYVFTVAGKSMDEGSGVERIVFYYMRKSGTTKTSITNEVVLDPMITTGTDDSKVALSTLTERTFTQGEKTYSLYAKEYSGTATTDEFTATGTYDSHVRVGGLVEIDGVLRKITKIEGTKIEFTPSLSKAKETFTAYFPIAQVIDNSATEKTLSDSANPFTFEKGDDGDLMPESFSKSGKTWTWDASIHSDNMSDGPVSLVILAFDAAGNVNGKTVNTKITNNAPRIAKVWFGTDLSGDGKFSNSDSLEELLEYNILGAEGKEQSAYTLDFTAKDDKNQPKFPAGLFTIKNRLAVVPEFTGGNGEIGMVASTTATSADAVQGTVTAKDGIATIVTGTDENGKTVNTTGRTLSSTVTGTFTASNESNAVYSFIPTALPTDGTNKGMSFTFWDSTDETTQGQDSQNSVLYVKNFTVNQTDNIAPTVVINPFWWNKIDDNSIYDSASASKFSDLKGHIELERDWIATDSTGKKLSGWDGNTSETYLDSDPKVSGKVRFTGTAYDNVRLKSIAITFSNISGTDVATYDKTNSSWTVPATTLETEGYVFSVSDAIKDSKGNKVLYGNYEDDVYFGQKGHKIYWTLDIDTAKITGVAAKDISLIVKATDAANKTTADSTISNLTDDKTARIDVVDGTTNVSSYRVDVVPYITEVTTALSALSKKTPTMYSRTALGHYPVRIVTKKTNGTAGTFAENVTLSGFNLGENTTLDVSTLTTAEDSRTGGKSAAFSVTVNGISSLNNVNNNNARGSYETEITNASKYSEKSTYAYNRQPNNANNNLLTDDVYFDVWEFNSAAAIPISGKIEQPVMKIRPTDGKIGFAFVNGPLYFSMGGSESSQDYSYQYWSGSFDFFTSVGFTYDKLGNSYGVAAGGDINSYTADKFCFMTSRFGIGEHGQNGMYNAQNALRLESIGYNIGGTPSFDKQRIKSPSLATTTHGNATNVYLSYYDSMSDEVRFKAGTFNETTDSDWVVTQLQYTDSKNNGWRYGWVYVPEGTVPNGSEFYFCDKDGNNVAAKDADGNVVFESGTKHYTRGRYPGNVNDRKFCFRIDEETENDAKTFPIGQYNQDNNGNQNRTPKDLIYLKIKVSNIRVTGNIKDYDINSMYNYRNDKVSMIAMGDSSPSFPENGTVTRPAGEYVSLGVVSKQGNEVDDVVVATWYGSDRTLYYSYNNTPFTDRSGDTAFTGWSTPVAVFSDKEYENAGEYCKVSVDANGGVHIAAYDPVNLDLVYAYSESATSPSFKTAVVDANGVVGSNLTLDVALVDGKPVPYIGYYATSCIKPKYARFVGDWSAASIDGSIDDEITGNWEISVVPSAEVIEMQSNQHNDINIGVWKNGSGVLIDNATDSTHYVTGTSEISNTPNSYNSNSYGQCYGNGTKNPVLGYAVKNGASGDTIETAQMK
ncbi:MAG: hypothetical protein KBT11_08665, partial [Treponema sp.]|nr:hypothetical protein [Candidatus Treponema equifaecale]